MGATVSPDGLEGGCGRLFLTADRPLLAALVNAGVWVRPEKVREFLSPAPSDGPEVGHLPGRV